MFVFVPSEVGQANAAADLGWPKQHIVGVLRDPHGRTGAQLPGAPPWLPVRGEISSRSVCERDDGRLPTLGSRSASLALTIADQA